MAGGVPPGNGPIVLSSVLCSGSEQTLLQCANSDPGIVACGDAGVTCTPGESLGK